MSASKVAALLQSAPKRTLSELLGQLPKLGVGTCVARDTWHPESGKFWEITRVQPKKVRLIYMRSLPFPHKLHKKMGVGLSTLG